MSLRVTYAALALSLNAALVLPTLAWQAQAAPRRSTEQVASKPAQASRPHAPPTTQPAQSQPTTEPVNPLRSQASMIEFFDSTATLTGAARIDALRCLNSALVDPETWKAESLKYLDQLVEILDRLEAEKLFDRTKLSDDPAAEAGAIGRDPILIPLARRQVEDSANTPDRGRAIWQFSQATVKDIPRMYERLDALVEKAKAAERTATQPTAPNELDPLRSPYHMVQHFMVKLQEAANDPTAYTAAMDCLDFSQLAPQTVAKDGPKYVDQLSDILTYLRGKGAFDREKLTKEPVAEKNELVKEDSDTGIAVILVRTGNQWRFGSQTVARLPEMIAALAAQRQAQVNKGETPTTPTVTKTLPLDNSSPAATLNLFFTAMTRNDLRTALSCVDLSELKDTDLGVTAPIAGKIMLVLNRHKLIVAVETKTPPDDVPYSLIKTPAGRIELVKQSKGDRAGDWLFSAATVRSIDSLYESWESKPILPELSDKRISFWTLPALYTREYIIPPSLKPVRLGLQYWQWLGILLVLALGVLVRALCAAVIPQIARRMLSTRDSTVLPTAVRRGLRPMFTLAMVATWWAGLQLLDLGTRATWWASSSLRIVVTLVAVFASYRLIDLLTAYFAARASRTASRLDDVLVPLLQRTMKIFVIAVGAIAVAKVIGFQVGPLLAGLGVGGLAFGLAAQDTLKNFFGSVNVVLDRPFQVGDWVRIGDIEGTVESVGLRSSRLRTFYNSQVTVPNSEIMTARIDNMGRRQFRRISTTLGVEYATTPPQLEAFCEGIRELIRKHPYTRKDYFHVYVNAFGDSSINILLYCFHETPDWGTELRERHRLFLDIIRLAEALNVEFAFPTQTIHLETHQDNALPPAATPRPGHTPFPDPDKIARSRSVGRTPHKPAIPTDPEAAAQFGREQAAALARRQPGSDGQKPPTVTFD